VIGPDQALAMQRLGRAKENERQRLDLTSSFLRLTDSILGSVLQ